MAYHQSYADLTKRPKLFRKFYWGNFRTSCPPPKMIIDNRNKFVDDYSPKACLLPVYIEKIAFRKNIRYDHAEWYFDGKNYLITYHPYSMPDNLDGFVEIPKMYHKDAVSLLKTIPRR